MVLDLVRGTVGSLRSASQSSSASVGCIRVLCRCWGLPSKEIRDGPATDCECELASLVDFASEALGCDVEAPGV